MQKDECVRAVDGLLLWGCDVSRQVRRYDGHECGDVQRQLRGGVRVSSGVDVGHPFCRLVCVGSVCGSRGDRVR